LEPKYFLENLFVYKTLKYFVLYSIISFLFLASQNSSAQNLDSLQTVANNIAGVKLIKLVDADSLVGTKNNNSEYNILFGNVIIEHDGNTLTCDSAHLFLNQNFVEAFGNAHVVAANGADITADKMLYNGKTHKVVLTNNVHIVDKENSLQTNNCNYNVRTKYATFSNGGVLQNENTVVNSNSGTYNGITKDAHFYDDVVVTNPKYDVYSDEIKYNTITKIVHFIKKSTIHSDQTTITGKNGFYNSVTESGQFKSRTLVQNDENDIEANAITYNKQSGKTNAHGNVVINDYKNETVIYANSVDNNEKTSQVNAVGKVQILDIKNQREIFADKVDNNKNTGNSNANGNVIINDFKERRLILANTIHYNTKHKYMQATGKVLMNDSIQNSVVICGQATSNQFLNYTLLSGRPLLKSLIDKDSLFMKADSFFIVPVAIADTIKKFIVPSFAIGDSVEADSNEVKKTMIAIGNVKIFTDSMQAICDSLTYNQLDSVYKLYKNPVIWSRGSQAKGDTIHLNTVNNKMDKMFIFSNASVINYTGDSTYYNQISGVNIIANIKEEALQDLEVIKNAQSIYYKKEDNTKEYDGMVNAQSTTMRIIMKNKEVNKIAFYTEPSGVYYPMKDVTATNSFLENYKWLDPKRPKNKFQLD
jgi:lipopolysaccharide assembly outer membrane protein LptD (OstA)